MESEWVDFRAVKTAVSMEMVLSRYSVQLRRTNKTYLRGKCPLPMHHTSKEGQSFGVHTEKNAWSCLSGSCVKARGGKRGGNILDFIAVMENCSIRDAALKLAHWFNVHSDGGRASPPNEKQPTGSTQLVAEKRRGEEVTDDILADAENKPLGFALRNIDHSHLYFTVRGITPATARDFGVGFFSGKGSMHNRIVIPIHNRRGELVAYAGRSIDETEPRYKVPSGFQKIELFNLHRVLALKEKGRAQVIVVEGFFDCMKVHQAGHPNVVALMGSTFGAVQEKVLAENFSRVVLLLDGDGAGREAAKAIAARLVHRVFVKVVNLADGTQPDQLSSEEIQAILGRL